MDTKESWEWLHGMLDGMREVERGDMLSPEQVMGLVSWIVAVDKQTPEPMERWEEMCRGYVGEVVTLVGVVYMLARRMPPQGVGVRSFACN